MSRKETTVVPTDDIPRTVRKESLTYLQEIYPYEFIQSFILGLMETFVTNPNPKPTKKESTLATLLKSTELANALFWKYADEAAKTASEPTAPPVQPTLHLISLEEVEHAYNDTYSKMDLSTAKAKISALAIDYDTLDEAACAIAGDHYQNSKHHTWSRIRSSTLTAAIHTLIIMNYTRTAFRRHISQSSNTISSAQTINRTVQDAFAEQSVRASQLEGEVDKLNNTVLEVQRQNETLNTTLAGLNESMLNFQNMSLDTSFRIPNGTSGSRALFANSKYIKNISDCMEVARWSCVTRVARAYNASHPLSRIRTLLINLLETLLMPSTETEKEDTTMQTWLKANETQLDPQLFNELKSIGIQKLAPLHLDPNKEENYYHPLSYCLSIGEFFPKLTDLAKKFYDLRPSKKKLVEPAATSATSAELKK